MESGSLGIRAVWQQASQRSTEGKNPLLVVLHGRGDSPQGFTWLQSELQMPKLEVLLLQAPDDYYGGYSWYGMPPDQLSGILRSCELLTRVFADLERQGYPAARTMLLGFSQGCLMTLEFGGRYSKKLAGYVGISGYVYDAEALAREANPIVKEADWLVTHGTLDDVLPVKDTRSQLEILKNSGFKINYLEYVKSHTIDERLELPFLREWILKRLS